MLLSVQSIVLWKTLMKFTSLFVALSFAFTPINAQAETKGKLNAPKEVSYLMPVCLDFLDSKIEIGISLEKYGYKQRSKSKRIQKFRKTPNRGWNKTEANFNINFDKRNKNLRNCGFEFEFAQRYVASASSSRATIFVVSSLQKAGYKMIKTSKSENGKLYFRKGDEKLRYSATLSNGYNLRINLSEI